MHSRRHCGTIAWVLPRRTFAEGGHPMALTLTEANRMVQAALAKAHELNVKISVAVCDIGGNLLALNRMDGASAVSATVAQGKAAASAGFGRASGTLQADSPVIQAVIAALGGRMLPARGAVLVVKSAEILGASGATAEQDEQCPIRDSWKAWCNKSSVCPNATNIG